MSTAGFVTHVATSLVSYIAMQLLVTAVTAAHCRSLLRVPYVCCNAAWNMEQELV